MPHVLGLALVVCGVLSCASAIGRWHAAHRALQRQEGSRSALEIGRLPVARPDHGAVARR